MSVHNIQHAGSNPQVAEGYKPVIAPTTLPVRGPTHALGNTTGARVVSQSGLPSFWIDKAPVGYRSSARRIVHAGAKRLFDIVFALLALFALLPLLVLTALAIKMTDRGPVFFMQDRVGKDGQFFQIFKFRSMYTHSCDDTGVAQTTADDKRIMPIGRLIRRTSIDELPQLLNILKGEMSVVGPRPHVSGQAAAGLPYDQVVPYYSYRHAMRPGLTGWAQANGLRGPTFDRDLAKARIDHDVAYIQNFSVFLDLRIIAQTATREFFSGSGF
ncbi:sugar transferase [Devosia beringensis]|uniref:sugar transferase n=1 Tax=Devosia beringensis TaxID=2657486 RepID=UPI00186B6A97|nr:sugar transferase [Devosia beringensis]